MPRERGSALLSDEHTYFGETVRLRGANDDVICRMQSLRAQFRERPPSKAPMTPVLSEWTMTSESW
jgi:hypothetical protein